MALPLLQEAEGGSLSWLSSGGRGSPPRLCTLQRVRICS